MQTRVHGKWILAGEHAVLRGSAALAFPIFSRALELRFEDSNSPLGVEFQGAHGDELKLLFWGVMEKAFEMTGLRRDECLGTFHLSNEIPVGAGMGASAALCVAVGRWFEARGKVSAEELPEFCRQLENLFHGESSGVDIAVALSDQGLHFERSGRRYQVSSNWKPSWYISYSGKRGITSDCVAKVKSLWSRDPSLGAKIDKDMAEAVRMAEVALKTADASDGFDLLASAINLARSCFEHWGLAGGEAGSHIQMLLDHGAYAVKPTGSGDGGYILSLWRSAPPQELREKLIPLS
jgi:mevalonate kinase